MLSVTETLLTTDPDSARARRPKNRFIGLLVTFIVAVGVSIVVRLFLFQVFYIPSGSMEPTLHVGNRVVVDKVTTRFTEPSRGDVVVFDRPPAFGDTSIKELIKRVVARGGDSIEARDGQVYINGVLDSEPYLPPGTITDRLPLQKVPKGYLFMMGDNRGNSADSRVFGAVSENLVVGVAFVKMMPFAAID